MSLGDIFWLFIMLSALQPWLRQRMRDAMRMRKIGQLESERDSRVILLVHRQETMRFLGFPVVRYIDVNDSEDVLRAIQMTGDDVPLDIVLHTPGGLVVAALQIARAIRGHKAKVTVFVPHYAMSGGTLIALAADEIVMCPHSVLGPIDPQLEQSPAASLLKVIEQKPIKEIDDRAGQKGSRRTAPPAPTCRASRRVGRKAVGRHMDARLPDRRRRGEGSRLARQHQYAQPSARADGALSTTGAGPNRRRRVSAAATVQGSDASPGIDRTVRKESDIRRI
jgi:hypothetical protein